MARMILDSIRTDTVAEPEKERDRNESISQPEVGLEKVTTKADCHLKVGGGKKKRAGDAALSMASTE